MVRASSNLIPSSSYFTVGNPTLTIPFLRCGVAQTMDALYLFQQCAQCSLWMNCLLSFFERSFFVVTTPESCALCQFRKELVAQVSRSTVDDHVVDQSPFGALPEIECRLGVPSSRSRAGSPLAHLAFARTWRNHWFAPACQR